MSLSDATKTEIDAIIGKYIQADSPGIALAVKYKGEKYFKGYGLAKICDASSHITEKTIFHVGSVAKQFTAMCIVLLSQHDPETGEGPRLSLCDDVRKHVKYFPFEGITIRQLLNHGSGIREMLALKTLAGSRWGLDEIARQDIVDMVTQMSSREFESPGSAFAYSNTNFFIAGEIVSAVSGMPLSRYAQEKIFEPLGMNNTQILDDYKVPVANRAQGYRKVNGKFEPWAPPYKFSGPTSLLTTVEDLLLWDDNFEIQNHPHTVGDDESIRRLLYSKHKVRGYSMGLYVTGTTYPVNVFHNGATLGHRALLYRSYDPYPTHEITVALLSNLELEWRIKDEREADELVGKVKFAVTQNNPWRNEEESVEKHTQWILELDLQKYVGHYRSEEIAAGYDVKFDVGASSLQLSRKVGAKIRSVPLMQIGNDKFLAKGFDEYLPLLKQVTLTFVRGSITSVNRFYLTSDIDHERFAKFSFVKNEI